MAKLVLRSSHCNELTLPLPLFEYAERRRWEMAAPAARMVRRRFGISSSATANLVAELAGFATAGDR